MKIIYILFSIAAALSLFLLQLASTALIYSKYEYAFYLSVFTLGFIVLVIGAIKCRPWLFYLSLVLITTNPQVYFFVSVNHAVSGQYFQNRAEAPPDGLVDYWLTFSHENLILVATKAFACIVVYFTLRRIKGIRKT